MFARVSTYQGSPNRVSEGSRVIDEVRPELQRMQGNKGWYLLVDPKGGKGISISFWETEEDATRSTSPAGHLREKIARALGAVGTPTVQIYEIGTEIGPRKEGARFARVSEYQGSPDKVEDGIRAADAADAPLRQMQGFHGALLFVDRKSGRAITMSFWDSESSMQRSASGVVPLRDSIARGFGAIGSPTVETYEIAGEIAQLARKAA